MYFHSVNLRPSIPNTSGVSAIGVWMIACIMMVFGALTEYGIILYFTIKENNYASDHIRNNRNPPEIACDLAVSERANYPNDNLEDKKVYVLDKKTMTWIKQSGEKNEEKNNRAATIGDIILKNADSFSLIFFSSLFLPFTIFYSIFLHQ